LEGTGQATLNRLELHSQTKYSISVHKPKHIGKIDSELTLSLHKSYLQKIRIDYTSEVDKFIPG